MTRNLLLSGLFALLLPYWCVADEAVPAQPTSRWWKGNIHTHSLWSDGDDFPEMIGEWYRTHGYNFLALSDHNVMSRGMRWMQVAEIEARGGKQVLPKYQQRFGNNWVEVRGEPESETHAVRLKPLDEFRYLLEERGRFILIPGEEISDQAEGVPVHMNATNVGEVVPPVGGSTVREAISNNLRAVEEQAQRMGREILLHLNHPNFGYAITAEDLAAIVQERFFEVYNGHPQINHLGDASHPSVERLWDIANTIRLGTLNAPPLLGVATDDSHDYHGTPGSHTGRGWIMVRSAYLTPEHLIRAIKAGEFYASSGVTVQSISFDDDARSLTIVVDAEAEETYTTTFVGTRKGYDASSTPPPADVRGRISRQYSAEIGTVFASTTGTTATYQLTGDELYVRAVVTSSRAHPDPSFPEQRKQAWIQPFVPR